MREDKEQMATIYLAARYSRRLELCSCAEQLAERGYRVRARWLDGEHDAPQPTRVQRAQWAEEDLADLVNADWLITFTESRASQLANPGRGGRHVEFGYFLALSDQRGDWTGRRGRRWRRLIVIGPLETVFHCISVVEQFDTWEAFLASLDALGKVPS